MSLPDRLSKTMLFAMSGMSGTLGLVVGFYSGGNLICMGNGSANISSDYSTLNIMGMCTAAISGTVTKVAVWFRSMSELQTSTYPPDIYIEPLGVTVTVNPGDTVGATITFTAS
jgi:hypothetical protein